MSSGRDAATPAPPPPLPPQPWRRDDVRVLTTTELTTTGGTVWKAAHAALDFLEKAAGEAGLTRPGARILELGAGCGWLGMALARNLPDVGEVCLTEQGFGGALDHLRANVALNADCGLPGVGRVTTADLDWMHFHNISKRGDREGGEGGGATGQGEDCSGAGNEGREDDEQQQQQQQRQEQQQHHHRSYECSGGEGAASPDLPRLMAGRWDCLVGSDLVYNEAGTHWLPLVARALALAGRGAGGGSGGGGGGGGGEAGGASAAEAAAEAASTPPAPFYYAHTRGRYETCDLAFLEQCAAAGLRVEEVTAAGAGAVGGGEEGGGGCGAREASPPAFAELFPEQRVVVFRITVASAATAATKM